MNGVNPSDFGFLAAALALALGGGVLRRFSRKKLSSAQETRKWLRPLPKLGALLLLSGAWLFVTRLLPMFFGASARGGLDGLHVQLASSRRDLFGFSVSETVITTWIAMALILILAVALRLTVIARLKQTPSGIQNVLEILVESVDRYAQSRAGGLGANLSAYLFSVAMLMVGCALVELLGVRAPTSDICMTLALALITFALINYYGIKRKGILGRLKSLGEQGPIVLVLRVISDCAIPVSMACRLFGNMLGGMIVMDLVYTALGSGAVAVPSLLGLYFNVFHPLIQAFIFITLTLTFINEAIE